MNIHGLFCIISTDSKIRKNYILSSDKDRIVLPLIKLENTRYIHNEIRYHIKNMFSSDLSGLIQHTELSYIEFQHNLALEYIESLNNGEQYNDLLLLIGLILSQPYHTNYTWKEFVLKSKPSDIGLIENIIDFTIQKTVI